MFASRLLSKEFSCSKPCVEYISHFEASVVSLMNMIPWISNSLKICDMITGDLCSSNQNIIKEINDFSW